MAQFREDPRIKNKEEWEAYKTKLIKEAESLTNKTGNKPAVNEIISQAQPLTSLFNCPDCGKEISRKALSCPSCGSPISQNTSQAVTIELTSKKWKKLNLISALIAIGGLIFLIASKASIFALVILIGIGLFVYSRIMAWWEHG